MEELDIQEFIDVFTRWKEAGAETLRYDPELHLISAADLNYRFNVCIDLKHWFGV
jgi:hypothetical protein